MRAGLGTRGRADDIKLHGIVEASGLCSGFPARATDFLLWGIAGDFCTGG